MRFVHSWWMSGELLRGHTHDSQRMTFAIMGTIINSTVAIWAPTKLKALMHQTQSRPSELLESSTGDTMIQCIKLTTRTQERLWQLHKRDTGKMNWAFRGGSNNIARCEYVDKPRDVYKAYLQHYLHKLWVFLDSNSNGTGSFRQNIALPLHTLLRSCLPGWKDVNGQSTQCYIGKHGPFPRPLLCKNK